MIGTNVLESRYDEIIANPTPSVSGMNSDRSGSPMMNAGMNTDRMQSKASSRGTAVIMLPCEHGRGDLRRVPHLHVHVLDLTVASSTRIPIASARPAQRHDVDRVARQPEPEQRTEQRERDVRDDDDHAPRIAEEEEDHQPGQPAPISPSVATLLTAAITVGDSSNSKLIVTSLGTTSRNKLIDLWMSATTVKVEAVSFLMIGR